MDLAKKYGVSSRAIANRCKAENWVEERNKNFSKASVKVQQKAEEKVVKDSVKYMEMAKQGFQAAVELSIQNLAMGCTSKEARDWALVLKEATGQLRDFYNVPTPGEREARKVAREHLELEKQKAAMGYGGDNTEDSGVVFMPAVMEVPESERGDS